MKHDAEAVKAETVRQWGEEPAGAALADTFERGTPGFYAEVERTRYALYPWLRELLATIPVSDRDVLEVGVGLGTDHLQLARAGARLAGIDLTPASIQHTRRLFELRGFASDLRVADAEAIPFPAESFDVVYSFGVIHHTPDMKRAISEMHRVLRSNGQAFVALYNRYSYFHAWKLLRWMMAGRFRTESLADMRAAIEHGAGNPLVVLSTRADVRRLFAQYSDVRIRGRHLPHYEWPSAIRRAVHRPLAPLEYFAGWYLTVEAIK